MLKPVTTGIGAAYAPTGTTAAINTACQFFIIPLLIATVLIFNGEDGEKGRLKF
ncbi:hypothetical protein l13_07580 [Neisseria weaveri ATCC 51223]|nr:hypothetical protein l13_07580 [Neisseria weaveri ATCC 51223]